MLNTMFTYLTLFDRVEQSHDKKTKVATIEDLHQRLKSNIESIQQLNTQVSALLLCTAAVLWHSWSLTAAVLWHSWSLTPAIL